jgi:type IV pilus assembly protein PilQ
MVPVVALACAVVAGSGSIWALSSPARLLGVRPHLDSGRPSVLIEASSPVSYAASQPDPLTMIVDLRQVSAAGATNAFTQPSAELPVAAVSVEGVTAPDGVAVARVRLALSTATTPQVRSAKNRIFVQFDPAALGTAPTVLGDPARPAAARQSDTPPVASAGTATVLSSVTSEVIDGQRRIVLKGNGRLVAKAPQEAADPPPRVLVDLPGVRSRVAATIPVGADDVERVRVAANTTSPLVTRVVVDLKKKMPYRVEPVGNSGQDLAIVFGDAAAPAPAAAAKPAPAPVAAPPAPVRAEPAPPARAESRPTAPAAAPARPSPPPVKAAVVEPEPPAAPAQEKPAVQTLPPTSQPAGEERRFVGNPVSMDFQGVDLRAVLRTFAEITGLNLVIDPAVNGTVDVALRDVPWDQALDIILRANQLGYTVEGNIVRIAPIKTLAEEEAQRRKLADEKALSGELRLMTRTLSYARASQVAQLLLKSALSTRGSVQVDERTNTLIISDLQGKLDAAVQLLSTLDRAEPQVEIEARIVLASRNFARSIGVQWGVLGQVSPQLGNTTPLAFPNSGSLSGRVDPRVTAGQQEGVAVSLPAQLPDTPISSALGLSLGSINGSFSLDVALSAAEGARKARVLSAPRVTTQNNIEAEIAQGTEIPIQTVQNNTTTVTFKDAALKLRVTPQITAANTVILKIALENGTPGRVAANGNQAIDTQRATTQVLVNDGATTVIGGIAVSNEQTQNDRTPGIHRIPLLGWLFKRDTITDSSTELLIFISPRIIRN